MVQPLRRFCHALTGNVADADDLLQDTIVRLLDKGLPENANLRKWAFRVCKNIWFDELRARKVRRDWAREQISGPTAFEDGERAMQSNITLAETQSAMKDLPREQRLILSLVAVEGMSYRDAAETADVPLGTVMSRLSRARAFLSNRQNPIQGE